MADIEKVVKGLQNLRDAIATDFIHEADHAVGTIDDALALLKEQEAQKFFVDESGKVTPLPVVVRCKDCVYWDKGCTEECTNSDSVCFHNGWCKPDWFCADGERRDG